MGFDSFLGNANAVAAVRGMLAQDRAPGALLFTGPDGVGKKTLALMLAKAMNCERLKDDFCGECGRCKKADELLAAAQEDLARRREIKESQRRVEGLIYFDVQIIEPITRYILIEQIRQLRTVSYTRPFEFPRRVFIIDQAQTIHWQAVDLLLKVLEEPPETTTFVLVCVNPRELRPTIRSRCHPIPFVPVEEQIISKFVANNANLNPAQRALAIRVAAGSIAAAQSIDLRAFLAQRQPWLDFLDAVAPQRKAPSSKVSWKQVFDSTRTLTENRDTFEGTLKIGYTLLRDMMALREVGAEARIVHIDLIQRLKAWSERLGMTGIETIKVALDQAYRQQVRNVNQQLALDALAVELDPHLLRRPV
ncbi:MAG TPA: hypothetical protein VFD30_04550 [Terriglobia bacterium]|jgi:DNA polymerase-3 subunit delta'|nr:hypothetical protein [Terriglobia bacterium]